MAIKGLTDVIEPMTAMTVYGTPLDGFEFDAPAGVLDGVETIRMAKITRFSNAMMTCVPCMLILSVPGEGEPADDACGSDLPAGTRKWTFPMNTPLMRADFSVGKFNDFLSNLTNAFNPMAMFGGNAAFGATPEASEFKATNVKKEGALIGFDLTAVGTPGLDVKNKAMKTSANLMNAFPLGGAWSVMADNFSNPAELKLSLYYYQMFVPTLVKTITVPVK